MTVAHQPHRTSLRDTPRADKCLQTQMHVLNISVKDKPRNDKDADALRHGLNIQVKESRTLQKGHAKACCKRAPPDKQIQKCMLRHGRQHVQEAHFPISLKNAILAELRLTVSSVRKKRLLSFQGPTHSTPMSFAWLFDLVVTTLLS